MTVSAIPCPAGLIMVHDPLTPLDPTAKPTPEAIRLLRKELYTNARRNKTTLGGGGHGHLGLLMPHDEYITIAIDATAFVLPDLPDTPNYDTDDEGTRLVQRQEYQSELKTYETAHNLHDYLTALIVAAVPNTYIDVLSDDVHGFGDVSPATILAHLMATYGKISKKALAANLKSIAAPWNPDTPIEDVFTHANRCRRFAAEGGDPITDAAYTRILAETFTSSGVLDKAIEDWEALDEEAQTIAAMIAHFTKADNTRRDKQTSLKHVLTANTAITNTTDNQHPLKGFNYCWSHGICDHAGTNCPTPANGHVKEATAHNLCGGCTFMQRPPGYQAIFKLPPRPRDAEKAKLNKEKQKAAAKLAKATEEAANQKAFADAVALAVAAQLHH
jgi:hypothetical protein